ncbi:MAG: hypothetical protein JF597_12985 [Streptomyces sp.]|uniref:hypothetical protein n=1 Tax=Streptomyces sp. TaxID=1931 RepID=UPI0025DF8C75|nr:hypothetical protein [Streptomyces sp.]MBW8794472.1 hypothetical protein [Streptomyces sp.]
MTHEPEREDRRGVGGAEPSIPPMPDRPPQAAAAEWGAPSEVLSGPGPDREPGAPLRGLWRRQSLRVRAVTVALVAGALALGGTVAFAAGSGGGGSTASPAASGAPTAPSAPDGRGPGHGWFGTGGMGVHGEATVKDPDTGTYVVRVWQRGTVERVDGGQVTVKSDDGTSWTWTVGSDVKVRGDSDALKKSATAFLIGTRGSDGKPTASAAFSGDFPGLGRGGVMHHHGGPWQRPDTRSPSPSPSGSGAGT